MYNFEIPSDIIIIHFDSLYLFNHVVPGCCTLEMKIDFKRTYKI